MRLLALLLIAACGTSPQAKCETAFYSVMACASSAGAPSSIDVIAACAGATSDDLGRIQCVQNAADISPCATTADIQALQSAIRRCDPAACGGGQDTGYTYGYTYDTGYYYR